MQAAHAVGRPLCNFSIVCPCLCARGREGPSVVAGVRALRRASRGARGARERHSQRYPQRRDVTLHNLNLSLELALALLALALTLLALALALLMLSLQPLHPARHLVLLGMHALQCDSTRLRKQAARSLVNSETRSGVHTRARWTATAVAAQPSPPSSVPDPPQTACRLQHQLTLEDVRGSWSRLMSLLPRLLFPSSCRDSPATPRAASEAPCKMR